MRLRRAALRLLTGFALVGGVGCDSVLGIEDLPRAVTVDAGEDTAPPPPSDCEICTNASCAVARDACDADVACHAIFTCIAACKPGDPRCRNACEQMDPITAAAKLFRGVDDCRRKQCTAACYGSTGLGAFIDPDCACIDTTCAKETSACITSGAARPGEPIGGCERLLACIATHENPDGTVKCVTNSFAGAPEKDAVLDCARANPCSTNGKQCPMPTGEVRCTGTFDYLNDRNNTTHFKLGVLDYNGSPVTGANVRACAPASGATCVVQTSALTGSDGKATLSINTGSSPFVGYFDVVPPTLDPPTWPTLVYPGRTVHVDNEDQLSTYSLGQFVFDLYAGDVGKTVDPSKGAVIGTVLDCVWGRIAGAQIGSLDTPDALDDPGATLAYLDGISVSKGATGTTSSGAFAIINYSPGPHTLIVRRGGVKLARIDIFVRAATVTDANIFPMSTSGH